jgi:GT2 family glycosyltransferase
VELSVVLPTHNGAKTIKDQLEALARQEWSGKWEVVVVDNRSTDDTRAVVEAYRNRIPSLRVVDAPDKSGLPYASNVGIEHAAADAIAFCNDDDEIAEGWVAAMAEALRAHDVVAGALEFDKLNEPWVIAIRGRPQTQGLAEWGFLPYLPFAFGSTMGIRRSAHEAIGGYDEEMIPSAEDMDYSWRLQKAGIEIHFVAAAVTHYRLRHKLSEIYRQSRSYGVGNVLVYKKHRRLGMRPAPHPWRSGARVWLGLIKRFLFPVGRVRIGLLAWHLGLRVGMAKGSIKHRVAFF